MSFNSPTTLLSPCSSPSGYLQILSVHAILIERCLRFRPEPQLEPYANMFLGLNIAPNHTALRVEPFGLWPSKALESKQDVFVLLIREEQVRQRLGFFSRDEIHHVSPVWDPLGARVGRVGDLSDHDDRVGWPSRFWMRAVRIPRDGFESSGCRWGHECVFVERLLDEPFHGVELAESVLCSRCAETV